MNQFKTDEERNEQWASVTRWFAVRVSEVEDVPLTAIHMLYAEDSDYSIGGDV